MCKDLKPYAVCGPNTPNFTTVLGHALVKLLSDPAQTHDIQ